jgi:hypothetical protein
VKTVPLALVVALATGGIAFAVVSGAGQEDAREGRAAYEVGADVRVTAPPASVRAGGGAERDEISQLPGVDAVAAVDRELDFVDDVPVEVLVAELTTERVGRRLVAAASDPAQMQTRLGTRSAEGVPVMVTDGLAERAALDLGDRLELDVAGVATTLQVAGIVPVLPTVADDRGGLLVDAQALPGAGSGTAGPDEWWLAVDQGSAPEVATALRDRPELAGSVLTRDAASRRLAANPGTGGAALDDILTVAGAGALVIGAILLCSVVLLRRRERAEQAEVLRTVGAGSRAVTGTLAAEYAATTGAGAVTGVAAGIMVAALTLTEMTLGPGGTPLVPTPAVQVPWTWLVVATLVLVALPLVALLALARYDRWRGSRFHTLTCETWAADGGGHA